MKKRLKIVVTRAKDGYVAYPLGIQGVVIGDGATFEEALADVKDAIQFHVETFGKQVLEDIADPADIYIAEAEVSIGA